MQPITGRKIVLREGRDADIKPLYRYITDPQVSRFLVLAAPPDERTFGIRLREMFTNRVTEHDYIIARKEDNAAAGMIRLMLTSPAVGNVSYWMGRRHWSHGYATEALSIICTLGFVDWGLEQIEAQCFAGNVRSIKLLDRLGFETVRATTLHGVDPLLGQELVLRLTLATFTSIAPE